MISVPTNYEPTPAVFGNTHCNRWNPMVTEGRKAVDGREVLQQVKDALEDQGEEFEVERNGISTARVIKGMRDPKTSQIWFAGDANLKLNDVLRSQAAGTEDVVLRLTPRVARNVQYQVFAQVGPLVEHRARLAREAKAKAEEERRAAEAEFEPVRNIVLDDRQQELLRLMVESMRALPGGDREPFIFVATSGGNLLMHDGLPDSHTEVVPADLKVLSREGLLDFDDRSDQTNYTVTPHGSLYYRFLMVRRGTPVERIEKAVRQYLDAATFGRRYPEAYAMWSRAESELWAADSEQSATTVGHICREVMQEFADALIQEYNPPDVPKGAGDKVRTKNRIRAVLEHASGLGTTERPFLDALFQYWETLADLVQRQEHGGLKEGEPVTWHDARRVVFQTAVAMFEIDAALHRNTDTQ